MLISSHKYNQISNSERIKIETWHELGWSANKISIKLGRHRSAITRELNLGMYQRRYKANIAIVRRKERRKNSNKPKRLFDRILMGFIETNIKKRWSPNIIAHEWNLLVSAGIIDGQTVTGVSIYGIIYKHRPELAKYLIYQRKGKYHNGLSRIGLIPDRMDIMGRSEISFGDWEADTVISSRDGKSCLGVFVEKTTRMFRTVKMANKTADEMVRAAMVALEGCYVRSITYDNGCENVKHGIINKILGCVSWFARAYCSTDKPQIENRNKILRQFLPKGTNFDLISEAELVRIETLINERPMECMNWMSPAQAYQMTSMLHFYL